MVKEKHTVETYMEKHDLNRQSAINKLSKLKKQGLVTVSGGGKQKRIYTVSEKPQVKTNGFYNTVNKYSPKKLTPRFRHIVKGNYTIEHAIIDGIKIGDARTLEATQHLFRHVTNWKRLFDLAKKNRVTEEVHELYEEARKKTKVKKMPKRYQR